VEPGKEVGPVDEKIELVMLSVVLDWGQSTSAQEPLLEFLK
jgi:hypothetical protein